MSEFVPFLKSHAVERCAVTVAFHPDLPDKIFDNIATSVNRQLIELGFEQAKTSIGFNVDHVTGKITPITSGGPVNYQSKDGRWQIYLSPNAIGIMTDKYTRWSAFYDVFYKHLAPILEMYEQAVSVGGVKLEYWDRFNWTGGWSDFDFNKLVNPNGRGASLRPAGALKEWHNHVGWFEYIDNWRRLHNINVDVSGLTTHSMVDDLAPTVGIYTMVFDQASVDGIGEFEGLSNISKRLHELHDLLKNSLADLLNDNTKRLIGL